MSSTTDITMQSKVEELYEALESYGGEGFFNSSSINFIKDMKVRANNNTVDSLTRGQRNYVNNLFADLMKAREGHDDFFNKLEQSPEFKEKFESALIYYAFFTNTIFYNADEIFENHSRFLNDGERYLIKIPSVNRMIENKYFKKVWSGYKEEPKYEKGTLVNFRKNGKVLETPKWLSVNPRDNQYYRTRYGNSNGQIRQKLAQKFKIAAKLRNILNYSYSTNVNISSHLMKGPLYILDHDRSIPIGASNGNKIYHVLPLTKGLTVPIAIEERHLKSYKG